MNDNTGHGHVWARPDGIKARCGGPGLCETCRAELASVRMHALDRQAPLNEPTLRDKFAMAAMQGLLTKNGSCHPKDAYEMADAMLKERGK